MKDHCSVVFVASSFRFLAEHSDKWIDFTMICFFVFTHDIYYILVEKLFDLIFGEWCLILNGT